MPYAASVKSSIPKLTGPNKSIKAIPHVRALVSLGSTFPIKNTGGGAIAPDLQLHWENNDAGFKLFHPDIYAASFPSIKSEEFSSVDSSKASYYSSLLSNGSVS